MDRFLGCDRSLRAVSEPWITIKRSNSLCSITVLITRRNNKVPGWQELVVHLTTHRLLLLQALSEPSSSEKGLQTNMSYIRQTEFYVGFMRSSPKITLSLGTTLSVSDSVSRPNTDSNGHPPRAESGLQELDWSCPVCGHSNPIGDLGYAKPDDKCGLCGVTYGKSSAMGPNGRATPLSTSRPSTPTIRSGTTASVPPNPPSTVIPSGTIGETRVTCPACTFLNHPSIRNCEICDTPLPRYPSTASAKGQSSTTTTTIPSTADAGYEIIRLSFRGSGTGGKDCYRRLKNVLSDKAWESRVTASTVGLGNGDSAVTVRGVGIGQSHFLSGYRSECFVIR